MKLKYYLIAVFFMISPLVGVAAYEYSYVSTNGDVSYESNSNTIPFRGFDSFDMCLDKFAANYPNLEASNFNMNIVALKLSCANYFLYSTVNYMTQKSDLKVIYSSNADAQEIQSALRLASKYNLPSYTDSEILFLNSSAIFVGNSSLLTNKMGVLKIGAGQAIIKASSSGNDNYIALVGSDPGKIAYSVGLLVDIYDTYFSGNNCIIFEGCSETNFENPGEISNEEILKSVDNLYSGLADTYSVISAISSWELK